MQWEGGLGDVVGDDPPDVAAAVPAILGALGLVDLRPDGGIGRGEPDRMVAAADTDPSAAIAPGAARPVAGGTAVGPDVQTVSLTRTTQIGRAGPGVWSAWSGAMWISSAESGRSPLLADLLRCSVSVCVAGSLPADMSGEQNECMGWASRAIPAAAALAAAAVAVRDLRQRNHALLRNFPLLGHARYMLESIGPELRQYLVAGNNEERPFTRDQRRWVYASAKKENNYFGFGTDNDIEYTAGYPVITHRTFGRAIPPSSPAAGYEVVLPCAKVVGGRSRPPARVPAGVGGQHLGDELRFVVGQRHRRPQRRCRTGRLPAQHR